MLQQVFKVSALFRIEIIVLASEVEIALEEVSHDYFRLIGGAPVYGLLGTLETLLTARVRLL